MKLEIVMSESLWKDPRQSKLPAFHSSREIEAQAAKVARWLRDDGYSYEEIAEGHMERVDGSRPSLVQVYQWCHPDKSAAQVKAWRDRHCRMPV
jgi:hypothetical protein